MRVRILSDLHREFGITDIPKRDADLIILAGDISTKQNALPWLREFCENTPTAYVCGKHEFYGDSLPSVTERLMERTAGTNIHVLEDTWFSVGDWNVYGCTLWTGFNLHGDWLDCAAEASLAMNDYKKIRNRDRGYKRLSPRDTRLLHLRSVERMEAFLSLHEPERTIIVTHHAPSLRSLPEDRRAEPIGGAYASNLDAFIERHQPAFWFHGHIHSSSDYTIGKTRVIANPQGYPHPSDLNPGFFADLVLEI